MGLFSSVKKRFKKVTRAVKKEFKRKMKKLGKVLNSKWGKALMIVAAVFTAGVALAAAATAFSAQAATATFLTKFVAGAKAFVGALMNPIGAAKNIFGAGAQAAGTTGAVTATGEAAGAVAGEATVAQGGNAAMEMVAGGTQSATQMGSGTAGLEASTHAAAQTAAQAAPAVATTAPTMAPVATDGLLKTAGKGLLSYAKSPGGGQMIASTIQGYAQGAQAEEMIKAQREDEARKEAQWRDPAQLENLRGSVRDVNVPGGYLDRARRVSEFLNERQYRYPDRVTDPDRVAGYARSGG
jgi:cytoskeletal protein RodZ